ncbi:hypothetical protein HK103_004862 [Boothiomyces macroporosus]|uniref:Steroid 5-alpha reductase C-terminal domain-containing protein n=1 Tax=Boothiomyces macroporosus TaxID=261099 RepID=A0AAD5Y5L0_9FUNG|nr:hypothetical protein HK103_004862 [Boothiomyces macroporosus]
MPKKSTAANKVPFPWSEINKFAPRIFYDLLFPEPVPPQKPGFKHAIPIDLLKAGTLPVCLIISTIYKSFNNPTMMVYTALHGIYGLLWITKSQLFPDKKWERRVPWSQFFVVCFGLGMFWLNPLIIAKYDIQCSPIMLGTAISAYALGVFLHFSADIQKDITLQYSPGKLITTKLFALCRHPNYLGEFLIYGSFTALTNSILMSVYLVTYITIYWVPQMWWKEQSMSRYPEWKEYCKNTRKFFPFIY